MRIVAAFRLLTLLCFALFGGAMPVMASGEHVVICGADGVKRVVAYDFETGQPVEEESAEAECQDCFGVAPLLIAAPSTPFPAFTTSAVPRLSAATSAPGRTVFSKSARAPPSLIL